MASLPELDATERRILGALMEKQITVPSTYPMTLNALRTACNQTSSRDPVVDYDEATLTAALKGLRGRELVRVVWADTGRRTLKYHQLLTEQIDVTESQAALLTVMLLRGPQAPGELKTRSERLHSFADRTEVEQVLTDMAARQPALVQELPRQHGQKDQRWAHLLGDDHDQVAAAEPEQPAIDVLADGVPARDERVVRGYDRVAATYSRELASELDDLPFERWLLDRVTEEARGPIADAGCGPGHVSGYLHAAGATVRGFDLSPEMVRQARANFPDVEFAQGDLRTLLRPVDDAGWGGVLAWYSLVHLSTTELPDAIAGLTRVLKPAGVLVLGLHAGEQVRHIDELWGVDHLGLDFVLHPPRAVLEAVRQAGLRDVEWYLRGPSVLRDETTERLYVVARKG